MLPIIMLSILGLGLTAFVIDEFRDDDDDTVPPEDEVIDDDQDDTSGEGSISGSIFTGTDGDDSLSADAIDEFPTEVNVFDMLGGDDVVEHGPETNVTINGGEGNDTLSIENEDNLLDGGPGDDVLSAGLGSTIVGGEGDDVIAFDQQDGVFDGMGEVEGGAGDDTISVMTDIGFIVSDNGPVFVSGNEGADTFEVAIDQVPNDEFYDPRDQGADPTLVTIEDFTPGEDVLMVDVTPIEETSGRDLIDTELTELPGGGYELALTFSGVAGLGPLSTTLNVNGLSAITLNDIVILQS